MYSQAPSRITLALSTWYMPEPRPTRRGKREGTAEQKSHPLHKQTNKQTNKQRIITTASQKQYDMVTIAYLSPSSAPPAAGARLAFAIARSFFRPFLESCGGTNPTFALLSTSSSCFLFFFFVFFSLSPFSRDFTRASWSSSTPLTFSAIWRAKLEMYSSADSHLPS